MDNTNKIVKPNLRKKGTVTNEKTLANEKVSWTDENINRVENLSILEQAKQQNEIDSQQMKKLKEQKKKENKANSYYRKHSNSSYTSNTVYCSGNY